MNARQWKPGDVAMIGTGFDSVRAIVVTYLMGGCDATHSHDPHWHRDDGDWNVLLGSRAPGDVRPLVVIDPEDREQVKALCWARWTSHDPYDVDKMQATLRSLVAPAKPEEPLGLGAVVEDDNGARWVRVNTRLSAPWRQSDGEHPGRFRAFADIDAVKVLSEGVTA